MTEEYQCPRCHKLVSFSNDAGMWVMSWCPHCGFTVRVRVEEE